jgi:xylulokinase
MMWSGQTTTAQTEWIQERLNEEARTKIPVNLEAKILWMKENRPELYDKTYKFLQFKDYLEFRLTGDIATEWCEASCTLLFDLRRMKWSDEISSTIGIDVDTLPEVRSPTSIIGGVTETISEQTALKKGTYVVAGAFDDAVSLLGLNAVKPNKRVVYNVAGTIEDLDFCLDRIIPERPEFNVNYGMEISCHVIPKTYLLHLGGPLAGAVFRWLRDELGGIEAAKASNLAVDPYSLMAKGSEDVEPGSDGLIFILPHRFRGNKGLLCGLSISHTKAHVIRAMMEGEAFECLEHLEVSKRLGVAVEEVIISGGCSKSRVWRQIKADVLGLPVHLTNVKEPGCLGAAILAGVGVEVYKDPIKVLGTIVRVQDTRNPQKKTHDKYKKIYELRKSFRDQALPPKT